MSQISQKELQEKIQRGDDFKLVNVLSEWAFRAKHIPGSINVSTPEQAAALDPEEEIVLYCSGGDCSASGYAREMLKARGFTNLRQYAGGLADWEEAGCAVEGEWA